MATNVTFANPASRRTLAGIKLLALLALLTLAGCSTHHVRPDPAFAPTMPVVVSPEQKKGAIYNVANDVRLFEDNKARRVGDMITIVLNEKTQASKNSNLATSKNSDIDLQPPVVFGGPVTVNGTEVLSASVDHSRDFDGEGQSSQGNSLTGNISVTIAQVLPNGNLLVRGEKLLSLTEGEEFIRITGIVRPTDVQFDNTVPSTKIANAQISYGGAGAVADASEMGWMSRFFNSGYWPF